MNAIVSFCAGIIFIVISSDLGATMQLQWIAIICDILGGSLIGAGCKFYMDLKKADFKNREEILINLKELSNKILTPNDLKDIGSQLTDICSNSSEIMAQISAKIAVDEQSDNYFKTHMAEIEQLQKQQIGTIDKCVETLKICTESTCKKVEKLFDINSIKLAALGCALDEIKNVINETSNREIEHIDNFGNATEEIKKLPPEILDMLDECVGNIKEQAEIISSKLGYLTEDLEFLEKKRNESFSRIMNEIQDYNSECSDTLADEMKRLGDQYTQFELLCKEMIKQMTQMSENDYEIIKGMLNG